MKIDSQIDKDKKIKVFHVEGEVDIHHLKNLKAEIMDSIESNGWTYEINMEKVTYLDSSGLGLLVYIKKEITRHNGKLRILNVSEQVLNVFKVTKLDEFFEIA